MWYLWYLTSLVTVTTVTNVQGVYTTLPEKALQQEPFSGFWVMMTTVDGVCQVNVIEFIITSLLSKVTLLHTDWQNANSMYITLVFLSKDKKLNHLPFKYWTPPMFIPREVQTSWRMKMSSGLEPQTHLFYYVGLQIRDSKDLKKQHTKLQTSISTGKIYWKFPLQLSLAISFFQYNESNLTNHLESQMKKLCTAKINIPVWFCSKCVQENKTIVDLRQHL